VYALETTAFILSESETVTRAVTLTPQVNRIAIQLQSDSLSTEIIKTGWIPIITPGINTSYHLDDTSRIAPYPGTQDEYNVPEFTLNYSQHIIGGGTIEAQALNSYNNQEGRTDSLKNSVTGSLEFRQPLLKYGLRDDPVLRDLKIQRYTSTSYEEQKRSELETFISSVRESYWETMEKEYVSSISQKRLAFAQRLHSLESARFTAGVNGAIDTLSSAIKLLEDQERFDEASEFYAIAIDTLKVLLQIDSTTRIELQDSVIHTTVPSLDIIIESAREHGSHFSILSYLDSSLAEREEQLRYSLMPSLDIYAGVSTNRTGTRAFQSEGIYNLDPYIGATLTYTLPIRSLRLKLEKHRLVQEENRYTREILEDNIEQEAIILRRVYLREYQTLEMYQNKLAMTQERFTLAENAYPSGQITQLELFRIETELYENEMSLLRQHLQLKYLEINLDKLTGTVLQRFKVTL